MSLSSIWGDDVFISPVCAISYIRYVYTTFHPSYVRWLADLQTDCTRSLHRCVCTGIVCVCVGVCVRVSSPIRNWATSLLHHGLHILKVNIYPTPTPYLHDLNYAQTQQSGNLTTSRRLRGLLYRILATDEGGHVRWDLYIHIVCKYHP